MTPNVFSKVNRFYFTFKMLLIGSPTQCNLQTFFLRVEEYKKKERKARILNEKLRGCQSAMIFYFLSPCMFFF